MGADCHMNTTPDREAAHYVSKGGRLECHLCPHECLLSEGQAGLCRVRVNRDGVLVASSYGDVTAMAIDPIEKKPLYHYYPGHALLSLGSYGCNLHCDFCQNWELSQGAGQSCIGVAYTYSEPVVWYEFVLDCASKVRQAGYKNVLVTNGYINLAPLQEILPYIDAVNIDLKGFSERYYAQVCRGRVEPVKRTIAKLIEAGINDDPTELGRMYKWLGSLDRCLPAHINRYFPAHKRMTPATPLKTLEKAYELASEHLDHVYLGNLAFSNVSRTRCPTCGAVLVERSGYEVRTPVPVKDGKCSQCGSPTPFVGSARRRRL